MGMLLVAKRSCNLPCQQLDFYQIYEKYVLTLGGLSSFIVSLVLYSSPTFLRNVDLSFTDLATLVHIELSLISVIKGHECHPLLWTEERVIYYCFLKEWWWGSTIRTLFVLSIDSKPSFEGTHHTHTTFKSSNNNSDTISTLVLSSSNSDLKHSTPFLSSISGSLSKGSLFT